MLLQTKGFMFITCTYECSVTDATHLINSMGFVQVKDIFQVFQVTLLLLIFFPLGLCSILETQTVQEEFLRRVLIIRKQTVTHMNICTYSTVRAHWTVSAVLL